jgi:hypothetical protein
VTGKVFAADLAAPTPALLSTAVNDVGIAYTDAAGRANPGFVELSGGTINDLTLQPGLYKWSGDVAFSTTVTFRGSATDIWILQIAGSVAVGSGGVNTGANVVLENGARAENIFWQVAGNVNVGTYGHLEGVFLVASGMIFRTGSSLNGAALVQTAVTLDATTIVKASI